MYNLNETYTEYQYLETHKSEGMKTLVEDNQFWRPLSRWIYW